MKLDDLLITLIIHISLTRLNIILILILALMPDYIAGSYGNLISIKNDKKY
jgi:hypothetical protein